MHIPYPRASNGVKDEVGGVRMVYENPTTSRNRGKKFARNRNGLGMGPQSSDTNTKPLQTTRKYHLLCTPLVELLVS